MRAYDVLCASTRMQCYDLILMLTYACLCRAAALMHRYDVLSYAVLCSDMKADYHMQPYAGLCKN